MGSAASSANTERRSSSHDDIVYGAASTAEEFDARAKLLVSKYHDLREGRVASAALLENEVARSTTLRPRSSLPRAEHKRLSRQLRPDDTVEHTTGVRVAILPVSHAASSRSDCVNTQGGEPGHTRLSPKACAIPDAGGDEMVAQYTTGESRKHQFVHRDEMIGLARELGYDITPEQATGIFDMLDSQRQGKISKDDLSNHLFPLLQRMGSSGPPRKVLTARRKSSKSPTRHPRLSASLAPGTKTPPRPAGTPPPNARRRLTSSPPAERGDSWSPASATVSPTSPSPAVVEKRKSSASGALDPISPTNHLSDKPPKFWLTPLCSSGGGNAPVFASLTPLVGAKESAAVDSLSRYGDSAEQEEKKGGGISGETAAGGDGVLSTEREDGEELVSPIDPSLGGEELVSPIDPSLGEKRVVCSVEDTKQNANGTGEDDAAVATKAAATKEGNGSRSRRLRTSTGSNQAAIDQLAGKNVLDWTAADVRAWIRALPRGLGEFAQAEAFAKGQVDGKRLAKLTLSDIKRKEFRHAKFKPKVPTALWVEIKQIQLTVPAPAVADAAAPALPSRFSPGQTIVDEAVGTPLCTVTQSVGQGAFGEVYQVVWKGIGTDRGETLAMKTVRLADISSDERDEYRVLLMEEILTAVRVKSHPNVVNVRFAHIMGFCSESEEYFCFEDFVTGRNLEELIAEGAGELYDGTSAEVQGRLLSFSIQLSRGLGYIHRCGVLHQDIKSANIMVSGDAGVLITDFGFATVGHFGPPPPSVEGLLMAPTAASTAAAAETGVAKGVGSQGVANKGAGERGKGQGLRKDFRDEGKSSKRDCVLFGTLKGYTPRYQSPEVSLIMDNKCKKAAAAAAAMAQEGGKPSQAEVLQDRSPARLSRNADAAVDATQTLFTHRSDMWAAGVVILEMYAGNLAALPSGWGENALDLLETLARTTPGLSSSGGGTGSGDGASSTGKDADRRPSGTASGVGRGNAQGCGGSKGRSAFRVDMPEEVVAILREIFRWKAEDRPESMEAVAARLSRALAGLLDQNLAVIPCPTPRSPSPSSLCEEAPVYVDCDENHAKVGRLHMWLGKALFLKGEDRREQALQEYREGVRVLKESKADRRSPSMALFRWYLGKALLENNEIDEALVHLTEAVSIDPESAKYRHTLGLAKCVTGDEAGAREDLLEAALLDEEDAEYRYQLRMQRINEKRKRGEEEQRALRESREEHEKDGGAPQGGAASSPGKNAGGDAKTGGSKLQSTATPKSGPVDPASTLSQTRLLALERASASTRTYALEKLSDYRTDRMVGRAGGIDYPRGGGGDPMDAARGTYFGGKGVRDATALPEVRRFSVGDEIACGPHAFSSSKPFDPLRCCRSSRRVESGGVVEVDDSETFVVDGLLDPGQASLHFPGEAYTALGTRAAWRRHPSCARVDMEEDRGTSFHVVHIRFEPDKNSRPATVASSVTATAAAEEAACLVVSSNDKTLAPIGEKKPRAHGAAAAGRTAYGALEAEPAAAASVAATSSGVGGDGGGGGGGSGGGGGASKPRGGGLSPRIALSLRSPSALFQREEEYIPTLKAAGRAAMVGFHTRLAGAMCHLSSGPGELTLVADSVPYACFTLREACASGSLYRGTGATSAGSGAGGGWGRRSKSEELIVNPSIVVKRILELARQTASAISHCHRRGILLRDITPNEVLVTHSWEAMLRPIYSHAHEGQSWTTVSIRGQQQQQRQCRSESGERLLAAPYTNATSPDYQSPEIARIRSEKEPRQRVSGRALRLSAAAAVTASTSSLGESLQGERQQRLSSSSQNDLRPNSNAGPSGAQKRERSGSLRVSGGGGDGARSPDPDSKNSVHRQRGGGSRDSADQPQEEGRSRQGSRASRSLDRRRRGADNAGENTAQCPSTLSSGIAAASVPGGGSGGSPMITACESDIWAWALMVLQMFSDEAWPPGSGQKGLTALEALLRRKQGVDAWTTEDVVVWLHDIGLWSEKSEREIRTFKIAGPQLLVPTCRRDIVEKLGLFIADGDLSCKLWENMAGGLQRWGVPPRLASILRRCLADNPSDRFSTMAEVCKLLNGVAADDTRDDNDAALRAPTWRSGTDEDVASDRLRSGMILNDIGVCLCGKGQIEQAERYYKMALLASDDIAEAYYNLGLLYITPAFNKFREARQVFDAAAERMGKQDPRRKASVEHSKAAERKSNYHQSQEMMKALSGKYGGVSARRGTGWGGFGGTTRNSRTSDSGGTAVAGANIDEHSRRTSFPPERKPNSTSSRSLGRSSASYETTNSSGIDRAEVSPVSLRSRSLTPH